MVVSTGLGGSAGEDDGDINVFAPITWASGHSLTLEAANDIFISVGVGAAFIATGAGSLT